MSCRASSSSCMRDRRATTGDAAAAVSFLVDKSAKVFIAGHRIMVGSVVHRKLDSLGFTNIVVRTRAELDLACLLRRRAAALRDPGGGEHRRRPRRLRCTSGVPNGEPPHHCQRRGRRPPLRLRTQSACPR
ncbi:Os02g0651400 [Oryza sativa Japonica Group]|uniref:Os02g0651400 protein n=1 Tax=Oryza sativa subsp. japonica TaxID=39947 RepID=A0A0P0VMS1_ORYSJ|nr:Os02g0651400 [Oryza sativa Japonica Group]